MVKLWSAVAVLLVAGVVYAQDAPKKKDAQEGHQHPSAEQIFQKLDGNNDGSLSLEEYSASPRFKDKQDAAKASFEKMDSNSDGKVTLEEMKAAFAKRAAEHKEGGSHKHGEKK